MKSLPKSPFPPYLAVFLDNPIRRLFINREGFLTGMGVKRGDFVLEVGCGPGFFTTVLSRLVGKDGRVYAQDIEEAMLKRVEKKLGSLPHKNCVLLHCNSSALGLPDSSSDFVLCANVLEEIDKEGELEGTVKEINRVLKPGGILVIKEHRFGGTEPVIKRAEESFIDIGYGKTSEKKTFLSYHSRFTKPGRTRAVNGAGSSKNAFS